MHTSAYLEVHNESAHHVIHQDQVFLVSAYGKDIIWLAFVQSTDSVIHDLSFTEMICGR
jgi:hypothetical protein